MSLEKYTRIRETHLLDYHVPEDFFEPANAERDYCVFLISCLSKDKFIYLDPNFYALTGYSNEVFMRDGMDFWFSLICPEDMESVTARIIGAYKSIFSPDHDPKNPAPLILEYRFKHADGHWAAIRDTRYLVSFNEEKVIDKVLCRFESLSSPPDDMDALSDLLTKKKLCTKALEQAMVYQNAKNKQSIGVATRPPVTNPSFINELTKREKEILQLIGQGLSTKMIAERCFISIHTVETHRRHLLEKLHVKNSMELIKEASKVFWL